LVFLKNSSQNCACAAAGVEGAFKVALPQIAPVHGQFDTFIELTDSGHACRGFTCLITTGFVMLAG
jgi:hypothetical protein